MSLLINQPAMRWVQVAHRYQLAPFGSLNGHSDKSNPNGTFGTLWPSEVKRVIEWLALTAHDHVLDFGAGTGSVAMLMALGSQAKVTGIELSERGCDVAWATHCQLAALDSEAMARCEVIHGDGLKVDWQAPTALYVCNTCFTDELNTQLAERIEQAASLCQIISTQGLPLSAHFKLKRRQPLECSWGRAMACHYVRVS